MRKCFIHIGTHKTGTTAIQHLLSRNSSTLAGRGFLYPQSGRLELHPGHHNLAWEISGDHRFQNHHGTIDDLIREARHKSEDIILSSEDFECALYHPSRFASFISSLQSCGLSVTVILYVRNQIDYLPRIYLTLLHFGLNETFDRVLGSTLAAGEFRWRDWIFNFDYCDLLSRIDGDLNINLIVRSYDQAEASVCRDFLSIFKLTLGDLDLDEEIFENQSLPLRNYLRVFLKNRIGRELFEDEERAMNILTSPEADKIELSDGVKRDLFQRFSDTNQRLFIECGIPAPKMEIASGTRSFPTTPYVDHLFSENTENSLAALAS